MKERIIQITTPASPIFAVFNARADEDVPGAPQDLELVPCPVLALMVVHPGGDTRVVPLTLSNQGIDEPEVCTNFLGYASSASQANDLYISGEGA